MPFSKRVLAPFLLAATLCLAAAACGGSSDKAASSTTKAKGATSTTAPAGATATTAPGNASATTTSPASGPTTTLVGSHPDSKFCVTVKRLNDDHSLDPATIGQSGGPEKLQKAFTELENAAPSALKPAIRIVADALADISDAKKSTQQELDALNSQVTQEKVASASTKLENYVKQTCGVVLGG